MDLKVVFAIVCLSALAIASTDAFIPQCCIAVKDKIPIKWLFKVSRWEMQEDSGACDIKALQLFFPNRSTPICANPKLEKILIQIMKSKKQAWTKTTRRV